MGRIDVGAAARVVRAGYDRRGEPSTTVVIVLALACIGFSLAFMAAFLWWQPPHYAFFVTLGVLGLPAYAGAAFGAWRGHVIGAAITAVVTTYVSLLPFAATFSIASGVQFQFLAVGFLTLVMVPERFVATRIVFCGVIILTMIGVEVFAQPSVAVVPIDDPVFGVMASVTRLGGIAIVLTSLALILMRTARAERELTRLAAIGEQRANTDDLTGIANRRPAMRVLAEIDADPARTACLALIDIDHFKDINDARGHAVGDDVIREIAQRLDRDLGARCVVARWGGDEFLVISRDAGMAVADALKQVRADLAYEQVAIDGDIVTLTLSVGLAYRAPGEGTGAVLAAADRALYEAKTSGRDRISVAGPRR